MAPDTPWTQAEYVLADARRRVQAMAAPRRGARRQDDRPRLRLVGTEVDERPSQPHAAAPAAPAARVPRVPRARPAARVPTPASAVTNPLDPRWVLALRTAENLQGAVLPPERREALLKVGRAAGLSPFEANLTIAIVQDQARRGVRPEALAATAEPQLRMVPVRATRAAATSRWRVAYLVAGGLAAELATLWWWLG